MEHPNLDDGNYHSDVFTRIQPRDAAPGLYTRLPIDPAAGFLDEIGTARNICRQTLSTEHPDYPALAGNLMRILDNLAFYAAYLKPQPPPQESTIT